MLAFGWFLGYVVLLVTIPYQVPLAEEVASAAALAGYDPATAYRVAAGWTLAGLVVFALLPGRTATAPARPQRPRATRPWFTRTAVIEAAIVFGVSILLYFPTVLAKYGPYIEDGNMLTVLHRMHGGQVPYRDFVFLYGPLMIYPQHWWMQIAGYSMSAYYTYLAVLVGLQFAALVFIVNRFIASRTLRWAAFAVIACFLVETLLGVNWNGTRRFVPLFPLFAVALAPGRWASILFSGAVLGGMLAYSHDYGVAGLAAVVSVYGLRAVSADFRRHLGSAAAIVLLSGLVWLLTSLALLRDSFSDYLATAVFLVRRYSVGEAAFGFYWTVNSLAVFGLICLACFVVGRGLRSVRRPGELLSGDTFLFGAFVYALVLLKSGLNRSDFWHLDPAVLGLVLAFVLPWQRRAFQMNGSRRLSHFLVVVCALTYLVGSAPSGSYYAAGFARGVVETVRGASVDESVAFETAAPALLWESGRPPDPDLLELARYLSRRDRPVLFYTETWSLGKMIGVYKTDRLMDDLVFSDGMALALREFLEERPKALVLMPVPAFNRLFGHWAADDFREYDWYTASPTKRLGAWLASVHFRSIAVERRALEQRLNRTVGFYIRDGFEEWRRFGDIVLLGRKGAERAERPARGNHPS